MLTLEVDRAAVSSDFGGENLIARDPEAPERRIALTAFYPNKDTSLLDPGSISPRVAIIHPGFTCSRKHPDTAVVARTLSETLDITTVTLDARGTHDSHSGESGSTFDFTAPVEDFCNLARSINPSEGIILGGHCLGGTYALAAAATLSLANSERPSVIGVFTDKTPAQCEDFAQLPTIGKRVAKGLPFFQQDPTTGEIWRRGPKLDISPESFSGLLGIGTLAIHLANIPSVPVLITASPEDTDVKYDNLESLADRLPNAQFSELSGMHSDIRPRIAYATGLVVANWVLCEVTSGPSMLQTSA